MAAETTESGGPAADTPSTDPSTNWIVVGGSLRDSIAFDTSSSLDADAAAAGAVSSAKGATFLREPASGCGPCEINICFRQKYDIHRVYVRSTAHVYEIYQALEQPCQSNEYVCTVRCGEASTKILLPEINEQTLPIEHHSNKQASSDMPATSAKSSCTDSSNEDGWVDVNVPDSPVLFDKNEILKSNSDVNFSPKAQTCYDATVEISDLSPCISITLRLLSLQPKGQVYIEEIYIYADPVGTETSVSNQGMSSGSNMSGTSLLSMLVPGLLQFSKSGNSRRKDKGISDTCDTSVTEETENVKFGIAREIPRETYFSEKNSINVPEEVPVQISPQNANLGSCQEVPDARTDTPCYDASNVGYSRIEKILEELLSRVGRIETFCASVENKMAKPLVAIEMKLQKLEQQLDLLTERTNYSKPPRSPIIFVPEFACVGSGSENRDHDASVNPEQNSGSNMSISEHSDAHKIFPAVLVRAPEFEQDDTLCSSSNTNSSSVRENLSKEKRSLHDTPECNQDSKSNAFFDESVDLDRERNHNGMALKFSAPEFFSEDYPPSGDDASAPPERNQSNDRSAFSIDTALASALEALLSSTTKSPTCNRPFDAQERSKDCKDGDPVIEVASEEAALPEDSEHLDVFCNEKERKNDISTFVFDRLFPLKGTNVQESSGIASKIISEIDEIQQPPTSATNENHNKDAPSATFEDWNISSMAIDAQNGDQFPLHTVDETHVDTTNISDICGMTNSPTCLDRGKTFTGCDVEEADKHQNKKLWFGESSTESIMDGLNVDSGHAGWSDLSSTDSMEVKFPLPSWLTGRVSDCESETDNIGGVTAGSSNAGSELTSPMLMNPEAGTEPEKTFNSLLDSPQIILEYEYLHDANQTSASVLEDLRNNFSNAEEKLCKSKDDAGHSDGGLSSSSEYCANASKSSVVDNEPLIDIEEDSRAEGFGSSIDVNQPLADVEEIIFTSRSSSIEAEEHSHTIPPDLQLPFSSLI